MVSEREDLIKAMTKIEHKETHYKHEIRSREQQISKLNEQLKAKLVEKSGGKENSKPSQHTDGMITNSKIIPSNEVTFTKLSAESDMHLMISKSQEESYKRVSLENQELKECLKSLQREMFDIVKLKSDIYIKRFKAENYRADDAMCNTSSEEILKHEIEKIRDNIFNLPFEETGRDIIHKFKMNFQKLKTFMEKIDNGINSMHVFNENATVSTSAASDDKGMTSVNQLKELLRNYEGIVES